MRYRPLVIAFVVAGAAAGAQEPGRERPSASHAPAAEPLILPPESRARVEAVAQGIICYCGCERQTVGDCVCGVADEIKRGIWNDLQAGRSPREIVDAYVAQHGEVFRSAPQGKGLGLVAWAVPWTAILLGGVAVMIVVSRWARRGRPSPPQAPKAGAQRTAGGDPYEKQLEDELERYD